MGNVDEKEFVQLPGKYGYGLCVEKYKNEFSIGYARKSDKGEIWKVWCFPVAKDRKPHPKMLPWKLKLGFKEQAIQYLEKLIYIIGGMK